MADFSVASVFSDNSVLQRNRAVSIFGKGKDGLEVRAGLYDSDGKIISENSSFARDEKWKIIQIGRAHV